MLGSLSKNRCMSQNKFQNHYLLNKVRNILRRITYVVLAFSVLGMFQGCKTYRMTEKDTTRESLYAKYLKEKKYFILYNVTGIYHLSDIQIINGSLIATVASVDSLHFPYLIMAGEDSPVLMLKSRNPDVDSEVILYTALEMQKDSKSVMIPLSSVQKMNTYKWGLTDGAQLAITIARTGGDAGDVVVLTYGVHFEIDTLGSRLITTK